jgi:hypothetical protein
LDGRVYTDNKHLMASFDEAGNMAKGDQGQIFSTWNSAVMVAIDGRGLFLWILVLEKYLKYLTSYSSMDGMEVGFGTLYFSWERCYRRHGKRLFFNAGIGKQT